MLFRKGNVISPSDFTLEYAFNRGTLEERDEIRYWLRWITFNFGYKFEETQRWEGITFNWSDKYWSSSYSGLEGYNMTREQSYWNCNFHPSYQENGYVYKRYVICHELFHLLGAEHGMKNPNGPNWLPDQELWEILTARGFSEHYIEHALEDIDTKKYIITPFDEFSFMDYFIDCEFTIDGKKCGNSNWVASLQDMECLADVARSPRRRCFVTMEEWDEIHGYPYKT